MYLSVWERKIKIFDNNLKKMVFSENRQGKKIVDQSFDYYLY